MPAPVIRAGEVIVGDRATPTDVRACGLQRLGQAEIQHLDRTVSSELDVRGFEIAVDDAVLVCRLERFGDLPGNRQRFVNRDRRYGDPVG